MKTITINISEAAGEYSVEVCAKNPEATITSWGRVTRPERDVEDAVKELIRWLTRGPIETMGPGLSRFGLLRAKKARPPNA
jgi:hypothetical protein